MLADFIFVYLSLCILPVLLPDKHWTRYYACYVSYILIASLFAFFYIPFHLLPAKCNRWWRSIGFAVASRALGVYIDVRGLKNGKYENAVMVLNHQSMIDSLICLFFGLYYSKCVGVCRKEVYYVWPFGLALSLHDCIFIDRRNGQTAFQSMLEGADLHMSKNKDAKVFIFPEGTRNEIGNEFLPFKSGGFRLAVEKQVPIIPVVISPYYFLKNKQFFSKGKIIISVLDPISTKGMKTQDLDLLTEKTRNKMAEEYKNLSRDVAVYEDFLEKSYSLRYSQ